MKRTFTHYELTEIGIPPDSPEDVEYSEHLLADEPVTTLKYTELRRVIFCDGDGQAWAVQYETHLDGHHDAYVPDDHGWYDDTVEAVAVEQREVTVTRWLPVEDNTPAEGSGI